jgi:hypothetical protein
MMVVVVVVVVVVVPISRLCEMPWQLQDSRSLPLLLVKLLLLAWSIDLVPTAAP